MPQAKKEKEKENYCMGCNINPYAMVLLYYTSDEPALDTLLVTNIVQ